MQVTCKESEESLSTSTKGMYIPKLFGIFLYMRFVSSPALIYIFNHQYQYGFMDIYTLGYNPIPWFHFFLILSQHGPLAALSVGSCVHLTFLYGQGGEVSCFVLHYFLTSQHYKTFQANVIYSTPSFLQEVLVPFIEE